MACAHRGCKCVEAPVRRGELGFCSDRCAKVQATGRHEAHCPCGHAPCKPGAKKSR